MSSTASKPACKGGFFLACFATTIALVACIWLIFQPALPGIVHFDDLGNLTGLSTITDPASAWRWTQEGRAGPFGRPLALATFALQYYEWPRPEAFLLWNIALHIINALLVLWLAVLVAQRSGESATRQLAIGFCVALTWAVLPFLNTSVLFIVQRMALLSSTFVLAGLIAYLKCRSALRASWLSQMTGILALAGFGVLALLAKESGALIVIYALVLELSLLAIARERRPTLSLSLLFLSSLLLIAGLTPHAIWHACAELTRGFDLPQRLGSQGVLLPGYLKSLFLPRASDLNPFRFEFLLRDTPNLQWGIAIWLLLMASPPLAWWRGWKMAALALAWFFYGHVMESGWVNLEPYFAHRNYLPSVGLVFALVYALFAIRNGAKLWRGLLAAYMLLLMVLTWMNTSLWGNRMLAAEVWAMEQPRSVRAALNLAYGLERTDGVGVAQQYLDRFVLEGRDSVGLRLQGLVTACTLDPATDHSDKLRSVKHAIDTLPYEGWATDILEKLMDTVRKQNCMGVSTDQVAEIAASFLAQPAYQCSRPTVHNMLWLIGLVAMENGDRQRAMDFYLRGLKESPTYSMAAYYLDLAIQQENRAAIGELQVVLKNATVPRGVTNDEWRKLLGRVDEQLGAPSSTERRGAFHDSGGDALKP